MPVGPLTTDPAPATGPLPAAPPAGPDGAVPGTTAFFFFGAGFGTIVPSSSLIISLFLYFFGGGLTVPPGVAASGPGAVAEGATSEARLVGARGAVVALGGADFGALPGTLCCAGA